MTDTVYHNIGALARPQRDDCAVDVLTNAFLLIRDGQVLAVGSQHDAPLPAAAQRVDLGGRAVVPGLIDSHTHIVFGGERMDDMQRRARGETYEDIARGGGGIASTVRHTQEASHEALLLGAQTRLQQMLRRGVTTVEVKSGYGLLPKEEMKMLEVVQRLQALVPQTLRATVLAHIIPQSYRQAPQTYIELFCEEIMAPAAAQKLAQCLDVFVEEGAFSHAQTRALARAARACGLGVKLHVDQLRDGHGAQLAAELGALSADHLEYTSPEGARALAGANVMATLLPGCGLFLGRGPWPDGRALRDAGARVAVATDCNPGSSMVTDLLLCATLSVTRCGLRLEEALWGVTAGGARALGLNDRGTLKPGERADFVVVGHTDWRSLFYAVGDPPIYGVVILGQWALRPEKIFAPL